MSLLTGLVLVEPPGKAVKDDACGLFNVPPFQVRKTTRLSTHNIMELVCFSCHNHKTTVGAAGY
eukprot:scaffold76994_cov76-Attheya_sp.AAC.1